MEDLLPLLAIVLVGAAVLVGMWWSHRSRHRRQASLAVVAEELSLMFFPDGDPSLQSLLFDFALMQAGRGQSTSNLIRGNTQAVEVNIFDYHYVTGSGKHRRTHHYTAVAFQSPSLDLPQFELGPENFFHKLASAFGYQDIDFAGCPEFNKRYLLRGANEKAIRKVFTVDVIEHFEGQSHRRQVAGNGNRLLIYEDSLVKPEQIRGRLEQAFATFGVLKSPDSDGDH